MHYLYVAAPVSFEQKDCEPFRLFLETQLAENYPTVQSVKIVLKENLFGFQGNQKAAYLKVTVTDPRWISKVRTCIEEGNANYKGLWKSVDGGILTFDSIQYILRFMIDCKVRVFSVFHVSH